jgi:hypothetical protein
MPCALSIEERLHAVGQPGWEAIHQIVSLNRSAVDVVVRWLRRCSERIKEHLDGLTRDKRAPPDPAADKPPLINPVLNGLRAYADQSGCLARRHVPAKSSAGIRRDERLLHQPLDGDRRALVVLSAQSRDYLANDLGISPAQSHASALSIASIVRDKSAKTQTSGFRIRGGWAREAQVRPFDWRHVRLLVDDLATPGAGDLTGLNDLG